MAVYRMDVYHRPEGQHRPVLFEQQTIIAANHTDAIFKAQKLYGQHDAPSVTGFMLHLLGARRSDDAIVHNHLNRSGSFEIEKTNMPEKAPVAQNKTTRDRTAQIAAVTAPPARTVASGEEVIDVPDCVGFD